MTLSWQLVAVLVAVLACATWLATRGLVQPAVATGAIGTVLGWLIPAPRPSTPAPMTRRDDPPATPEVKP